MQIMDSVFVDAKRGDVYQINSDAYMITEINSQDIFATKVAENGRTVISHIKYRLYHSLHGWMKVS